MGRSGPFCSEPAQVQLLAINLVITPHKHCHIYPRASGIRIIQILNQ